MSEQLNPMNRNVANMIDRINSRLTRWRNRFGRDSSVYAEAQSIIRTYFEEEIWHDVKVQGQPTIISQEGTHFLSKSKRLLFTNTQLSQLERLDKLTNRNMISNLMKLANRAVPDANYQEKMNWIRKRELVLNFLKNHLEENYGANHEWKGDAEVLEFLKKSRSEKTAIGYEEVYEILRRNEL